MKAFSRLLVVLVPVGLLLTVAITWRAHREARSSQPAGESIRAAVPPANAPVGPLLSAAKKPAVAGAPRVASSPVRVLAPEMAAFEAWVGKFEAARADAKTALVAEGLKLAEARREAMTGLIRQNPEEALRQALPYHLRKVLPTDIAAAIEQPVSGRGAFKTIHVDPLPSYEHEIATLMYEVEIGRASYEAHPYGRRLALPSRRGTWLHGIAVAPATGQPVMALSSEPLREVDADEARNLATVTQSAPASSCALCGTSTARRRPVYAELDRRVLAFCGTAHFKKMNQTLGVMESRLASASLKAASTPPDVVPPAGYSGTQGIKTLLLMPVLYADDPVPPATQDSLQATAAANNRFYVEGSYGTISWQTTVTPPLRLPYGKLFYGENLPQTRSDALAVAATLGYFGDDYDQSYVVFNSQPQAKFGGRSDGLLNGGAGAISHELGHNLGFGHANYWEVSGRTPGPVQPRPPQQPYPIDIDSLIGHDDVNAPFILGLSSQNSPILEYGDIYDVMGGGGGHFGAAIKRTFNWLTDLNTRVLTNSATARVFAFDTPHIAEGRTYALRFQKDDDREYWFSHRQGFPDNPWMSRGLEIQWLMSGQTLLVDSAATTAPGRYDAPVVVGRTFKDVAAGLYVTPIAKGSVGSDPGDEYVDVVVNVGRYPGNQPPTVSVQASELSVPPDTTVTFTASAQDPDGDSLAYYWEFGDTTFSAANAPDATKTFTEEGQYVVRCEVSDMKGGLGIAYVVVVVGNPTTVTMSGRVIDASGNGVVGVRIHNSGTNVSGGLLGSVDGQVNLLPSTNRPTYQYSYTDSQGYYTIGNIPPGVWTNRAFIYGYECVPQFFDPVDLSNGSVPNLDFLAMRLTEVSITSQYRAGEPDTVGRFTATRTGDSSQELMVRFGLGGTAVVDVDYLPFGGVNVTNWVVVTNEDGSFSTNETVTVDPTRFLFPAGVDTIDLDVVPIDNTTFEGTRTVVVNLLLETNDFRYGTILTNVVSTNGVTNTIFITVTNQLRIPGWELRTIGPNPDLQWVQTYPTYILGGERASMDLTDDEPPGANRVSVLALDTDAVETGGDTAMLAFSRTGGDVSSNLTVYFTTSGVASNGLDYLDLGTNVVIPAGESFVLVPVVAINDLFVEGNEPLEITLLPDSSYEVVGDGSTANLMIVDDDLPYITVYASDSTAEIAGGDPGEVTFSRSGDLSRALQINYLISGTATSGVDFVELPGSVIIPPGQISAAVQLVTLDNPLFTVPRTAVFQVSDSPTYNIARQNTAAVTILRQLPRVTVQTDAQDNEIPENGGSTTITFTRTGSTNAPLLVNYEVGGSAVPGQDYVDIGTNVVIAAGAASASITLTAINDNAREDGATTGYDRVIVHVAEAANYRLGNPNSVTLQIRDDENDTALPAVSFIQRNSSVREDAGQVVIPVRISANPQTNRQPAVVEYRVVSGNALPNVNYTPIPGLTGSVQFVRFTAPTPPDPFYAPEDGIQLISIPILNDGVATANRNFTLQLSDPRQYITNIIVITNQNDEVLTNIIITAPSTNAIIRDYFLHTVTIIDVGVNVVTVSTATNLIYETGLAGADFTITREGSTSRSLLVYLAARGIAAPGNDFVVPGTNATILIPAGTNSVTFTLLPFDDPTEETAETVSVTLLKRPGYQVGSPDTASVTIVNNDGTIQFVKATYDVIESDGEATVGVQRTGDTNVVAVVDYRFIGGTASNGLDYVGVGGSLLFQPGEVLKTISFPLLDDPRVEPVETVVLALTNSSGGVPLGGQWSTTVSIHDDDSEFNFASTAFSVNENAGNAPITVVRRGVVNRAASVVLATADLTATNLVDYVGTNVTLEFLPGESNKVVLIPVLDDVLFEPDERVALALDFASTNAAVGSLSNAVLTIVDDECTVQFTTNAVRVPEFAGSVRLDVRRTGGTVNPVSVEYFSVDGTATNGGDYTSVSGVLNFAAGQTLASINVPLLDDRIGEGPEFFTVHLSNVVNLAVGALPGSAVLGSNDVVTVNLQDNETPGSLEVEFNPNAGPNARVRALAQQSDGRTVFGGDFTELDETTFNRVARLTANGLLDPSFNPGFGANDSVYSVAIARDDRIFIGGAFTQVDATSRNGLARLNTAGGLDTGFTVGAGFNGIVRAIAPLADGSVLVGGDFTTYAGANRGHLARLQTNGVLDAQFQGNANGSVYAIVVQPDGRIVIGGGFDNVGGSTADGVARLTPGGAVDPGFTPPTDVNGVVRSVALQRDGRILVGGGFLGFNGSSYSYLARLEPDGALDTSFTTGTGPNGRVNGVVVHANGRIILAGEFTTYNGYSRNGFARLRSSGTLDQIFDIGTGANQPVLATLVQSNTAVVIGGEFTAINGIPRRYIARIHGEEAMNVTEVGLAYPVYSVAENAGSLTVTIERFGNTNTAFDVEFTTADLGATAGADYVATNGTVHFDVGQLTTNITLFVLDDLLVETNETFLFYVTNTPPGIFAAENNGATIAIIDDEQSLQFAQPNFTVSEGATNALIRVARYGLPVGTVTADFSTAGGTAVSGGDFLPVSVSLTFADGQSEQVVEVPIVDDLSLETNEVFTVMLTNIVGAFPGALTTANVTIQDNELGPGTVDVAFNLGSGANDLVRALAMQPDGRLIVGGAFTRFNGANRVRIARMNLDGTLDNTFNSGFGPDGLVSSVGVRTDGKIALAGAFTNVNGTPMTRVARLLTNGLPDVSFNRIASPNANVNGLSVLSNGNLLVVGAFTLPGAGIARLRNDGSSDVGFNPGAGADGPVHAVWASPDGVVVAGGAFATMDGVPRRRVARFYASGLVDPNFVPPSSLAGVVYALAVQPDGKVILGGDFTSVGGLGRRGLARLNADGSLDMGFDPGSGADGIVYAVTRQADGKVVVAGTFTHINGVERNRVARVLENGALDLAFDPGEGPNGTVYAVLTTPDGKFVIGGEFTTVNGQARAGVARLNGDEYSFRVVSSGFSGGQWRVWSTSMPGRSYALETSANLIGWTAIRTNVAAGFSIELVDPTAPLPATRFYRVRQIQP